MNTAVAVRQEHAKAEPPRMTLANVVRGKLAKPMRITLFGPEKIGKSSWAADAPSPIFIGAEDGTSELDVNRFPEPRRWQDILDAVQTLTVDEHTHKTVVLDTVDWAEPLCWRLVAERAGKPSVSDMPYGKGYDAALDEWRLLLSRLDAVRAKRGMHVILLGHAWIKPFINPTGDDYDRYEMKVHKKASGLIKEWADCVLFANHETFTKKKGDAPGAKSRGVSSGARLIYTQRTAAWDAGNRYGLPETMPLSWSDFAEGVARGAPLELAKVLADIDVLLPQVDQTTRDKTTAWLALGNNAKDALKLSQLADKLRGRVIISNDNEPTKEESQS